MYEPIWPDLLFAQTTHLWSVQTTWLLKTSDAADDTLRVDLGGRRIIQKNNVNFHFYSPQHPITVAYQHLPLPTVALFSTPYTPVTLQH